MIRLAGRGRRADGLTVTWTIAEGRRGRRWREVVGDRGTVQWSLLYETDPAGRFSHLELATARGLATLHPEGDGTLHGNVVDADGVHHVEGLPFSADTTLVVRDSSLAGAAIAWASAGGPAVAGETPVRAVVLDPLTLDLTARTLQPEDLAPADERGAPILAGGEAWPLERSADG